MPDLIQPYYAGDFARELLAGSLFVYELHVSLDQTISHAQFTVVRSHILLSDGECQS